MRFGNLNRQSYAEQENKFYDRKQRNKSLTVYDCGTEYQGGKWKTGISFKYIENEYIVEYESESSIERLATVSQNLVKSKKTYKHEEKSIS